MVKGNSFFLISKSEGLSLRDFNQKVMWTSPMYTVNTFG